jgi:mRNA-degrading endonuclease RelE of RelBE toxin-antitoxin system
MHYKIYTTPEFDRLFEELTKDDQIEIEKLTKEELPENPYQGRALGFKFFREKRIKGKRVYFLIYDDYVLVLMVAIGDKKTQKKDIAQIKMNREAYLKLSEDISREL